MTTIRIALCLIAGIVVGLFELPPHFALGSILVVAFVVNAVTGGDRG